MSMITTNDVLSHQLKATLEKRALPYTEISLEAYPSKLEDVQSLSMSMSVPQVFFNKRFVGGVEQTTRELIIHWDRDCQFEDDFRRKYQVEIALNYDDDNRLILSPLQSPCLVPTFCCVVVMKVRAFPDGLKRHTIVDEEMLSLLLLLRLFEK